MVLSPRKIRMPLLPFEHEGLFRSHRFDYELAQLADRHYSRQKIGSPQFVAPGRNLVYRDKEGLVVFVWLWQLPEYRDDNEEGYFCSIFRNESERKSSEIILEAEALAIKEWGWMRMFTYVNPAKIASVNPGYCFKQAGWRFVKKKPDGKHLLEKNASPAR